MLPGKWCAIAHDFGRNVVAKSLEFRQCDGKIFDVPRDDRSDDEVQALSSINLVLSGAVAQFARPVEEGCPRKGARIARC